jgi:hypothetical protein
VQAFILANSYNFISCSLPTLYTLEPTLTLVRFNVANMKKKLCGVLPLGSDQMLLSMFDFSKHTKSSHTFFSLPANCNTYCKYSIRPIRVDFLLSNLTKSRDSKRSQLIVFATCNMCVIKISCRQLIPQYTASSRKQLPNPFRQYPLLRGKVRMPCIIRGLPNHDISSIF